MKYLYKRKTAIIFAVAVAIVMLLSVSSSLTANAQTPSPSMSFSKQQASANGFTDIGPLSSSRMVTFQVYVPLVNQGLLQSMVEQISSPQSPDYGHFLTVKQVEKMFTNSEQFNSVLSQLSSDNFRIQFTAMNSFIVASGSVSQIRSDLGLNVDTFSNGSFSYYSSYGSPTIPGVSILASNYTQSMFSHPSTLVNQSVINQERAMSSEINQTFSIEAYPATVLLNVYNESGLFSSGYLGQGSTIGLLDFYGNPYVQNQLSYYDQIFGLPAPLSLNIVPLGPYNPNLGIASGWDTEVSLDVQASHTMSPLSNITLYAANPNYNLAPLIAFIVGQDAVNTLSQSFSIPESIMANLPVPLFDYNVVYTDLFYEIGALEGITFSASTGDVGGSGFSAGPLGTPGYPSTSPFVTALGGTTTYISLDNYAYASAKQTAWSNYGFVPYDVNYGGSTGGISSMEPLPWYQNSLRSVIPSSFPLGRMVPDVSLNAAIFPGMIFVFGNNETFISGGTSEASPLFAGMIAFIDGLTGEPFGLINPALYEYGLSATLKDKAFYPISFGYTTPWTENASGYNLVTGLGSVNVGELAYLHVVNSTRQTSSLSMNISVSGPHYNSSVIPEFPDNTAMNIAVSITNDSSVVTNGSFNASVVTLQGESSVSLHYSSGSHMWEASYPVGSDAQGLAFVEVTGENGSVQGSSYTMVYLGYYVYIGSLATQLPYDLQYSVFFAGNVTWLSGESASGTISLNVYSYSILTNSYTLEGAVNVSYSDGAFETFLFGYYATGVTLITGGGGGYLYFPFYNGAMLQESVIMGPVASEPGAVAPGQYVFVQGSVMAPLNILPLSIATYENVILGSSITFSLVNSVGSVISSVFATPGTFTQLYVPEGTPSGLYNIMIHSSYDSFTLSGWENGTFFGQIWVSSALSTPQISINPTTVYEGQTIDVNVNISANGQPVEYGMYSLAIYPASLSQSYYLITSVNYLPLYYNTATGTWQGTITLPSGYSNASMYYASGLPDWAGPYDLYVSGESWNGILTTTSISSEMSFNISSQTISGLQNETSSLQNSSSVINQQIGLVQNELFSLNQSVASERSALQSEISSLQTQLASLNQSDTSQAAAISSEISLLQTKLANLNSTVSTQQGKISSVSSDFVIVEIVAIAALIIALIAVAAALISRRKP